MTKYHVVNTTARAQPCNYAALVSAVCGVEASSVLARLGFAPPPVLCLHCGQPGARVKAAGKSAPLAFCGPACRRAYRMASLTCAECGTTFLRHDSAVLQGERRRKMAEFFCSKQCFGRYQGRTVGLGAHPEHASTGSHRTRDYEAIWAEHLRTGEGARLLSRRLGIPVGTVTTVLATKRKDGGAQ